MSRCYLVSFALLGGRALLYFLFFLSLLLFEELFERGVGDCPMSSLSSPTFISIAAEGAEGGTVVDVAVVGLLFD